MLGKVVKADDKLHYIAPVSMQLFIQSENVQLLLDESTKISQYAMTLMSEYLFEQKDREKLFYSIFCCTQHNMEILELLITRFSDEKSVGNSSQISLTCYRITDLLLIY